MSVSWDEHLFLFISRRHHLLGGTFACFSICKRVGLDQTISDQLRLGLIIEESMYDQITFDKVGYII